MDTAQLMTRMYGRSRHSLIEHGLARDEAWAREVWRILLQVWQISLLIWRRHGELVVGSQAGVGEGTIVVLDGKDCARDWGWRGGERGFGGKKVLNSFEVGQGGRAVVVGVLLGEVDVLEVELGGEAVLLVVGGWTHEGDQVLVLGPSHVEGLDSSF